MKLKTFGKFLVPVLLWLAAVPFASAQTWGPTSLTNGGWTSIASSADGNKLFAIAMPGIKYVYDLSTNAGITWSTNIEPQQGSPDNGSWYCIASSADGNTLIGMNAGSVWTSTNAGSSWISNNVPGVSFFSAVALSADGTRAVAADGLSEPGLIYTSTNSGMTWSPGNVPVEQWNSVASSADGTRLAAVALNSYSSTTADLIYTSTNSGLDWVPANAPANNIWSRVACSADGTKLVATTYPLGISSGGYTTNLIYTSANEGANWTNGTGLPLQSMYWDGVASSADGSHLVAVAQNNLGGGIYSSTNYGASWISNSSPAELWLSVASSADGAKLMAAFVEGSDYNGGVFISQSTPAPQINIAATNGLKLSWTIPSTNFLLQQSPDLSAGDWTDTTNVPVLNLTNLQNEVTLPGTNATGFYRLMTPVSQ